MVISSLGIAGSPELTRESLDFKSLLLPVLPVGQFVRMLVTPGFGGTLPQFSRIGGSTALGEDHLAGGQIAIAVYLTGQEVLQPDLLTGRFPLHHLLEHGIGDHAAVKARIGGDDSRMLVPGVQPVGRMQEGQEICSFLRMMDSTW